MEQGRTRNVSKKLNVKDRKGKKILRREEERKKERKKERNRERKRERERERERWLLSLMRKQGQIQSKLCAGG